MEIKNLEILTFGTANGPDGINADVVLSDDVVLAVYRDWDNPQWYLYDVEFGEVEGPPRGVYIAGIDDTEKKYPLPGGKITEALEIAIGAIRDSFTMA